MINGKAPYMSAGTLLSKRKRQTQLWCYLFILPQTILYLGFTMYPIVMSYVYSFFEWNGYSKLNNFVGFKNFKETALDPLFWNAFKNGFLYMTFLVTVQVFLALLVAIMLNSAWLKGAVMFRTLFFLPVVTTTAVVGVIMRYIFSPYNGLVNEALLMVGVLSKPHDWLGSIETALPVVIVVGMWKSFGIKIIYWLAGLQSLPNEMIEAAKIDGAGFWRTLRYVTIPLLMPVASVIILISAVSALHVFDLVKSMTDGGPAYATDMVDVYVYRHAFGGVGAEPRVGYASAAGVFYGMAAFCVSCVLALLVRKSNGMTK